MQEQLTRELASRLYETDQYSSPYWSLMWEAADALLLQQAEMAELKDQTPYGWQVAGTCELHTGEFAEIDAKASARRIGGTCTAFPLFRGREQA